MTYIRLLAAGVCMHYVGRTLTGASDISSVPVHTDGIEIISRADTPGADHVVVATGGSIRLPAGTPFVAGRAADSDDGICISHGTVRRTPPSKGSFVDVTSAAGVRGTEPQSLVRTSPNCLFDQFNVFAGPGGQGGVLGQAWTGGSNDASGLWDSGTFCMPEILTGGAATGDYDGDGWADLYVTRMDGPDSLYRNNDGDGSFTDVSVDAGIASTTSAVRSNGVVFLDIDNDGDQDIYISTLGDTRMYLFVNDGMGRFSEEAVTRGADLTRPAVPPGEGGLTSSFSIAVGDYDGDGWLDMYTTEWFPRLHVPENMVNNDTGVHESVTCKLLRNLGGNGKPGHFADATWGAGIRPRVGGVDLSEDTKSREAWFSDAHQSKLMKRLLSMGVTRKEATERMASVNKEAAAMFDRQPARGQAMNMVFDTLEQSGKSLKPKHLPVHFMEGFPYVGVFQFGARFIDLDADGHQDLIVSGDFGTTQLYWNNGDGTFRSGPLHLLWDHFDNSMGASIGDINNDGKLDVLFTSMMLKAPARIAIDRFFPKAGIASNFEGNHLYLNDGKRLFTDVTAQAGVKDTGWAWGGILFDYDNDGWLDMAISNGMDDPETTDDDFAVNTPNAAFRNTAALLAEKATGKRGANKVSFAPVASQLGLDDRRDGRGYFEFDYDGDGDLDLFLVNHADYPVLYRNDIGQGTGNAWLRVRALVAACDPPSDACTPRDAIGAVVYLQATRTSKEVVREIGSSAAYMAHSQLTAHFGIGRQAAGTDTVHQVRIVWPSLNATRILRNVPLNSEIVVRAPGSRSSSIITDLQGGQACDATGSSAPCVPSCEAATPRIVRATADVGEVTVHPSGRWMLYTGPVSVPVDGTATVQYTTEWRGEQSVREIPIRLRPQASELSIGATTTAATSASDAPTGKVPSLLQALKNEWKVELHVPAAGGNTFMSGDVFYPEPMAAVHRVLARRAPNNEEHPHWGVAGTPFRRIGRASYADPEGAAMPGTSKYAGPLALLPSTRLVSNRIMSPQALGMQKAPAADVIPGPEDNTSITQLFGFFIAFVQHDLVNSFSYDSIRKGSSGIEVEDNIRVPKGDAQWDPEAKGGKHHPFSRSPSISVLGDDGRRHRRHVNTVTHFADLHTVYGTDPVRAGRLLDLKHHPAGVLRMVGQPTQTQQAILPASNASQPIANVNPQKAMLSSLMVAGDDRANLHLGVTAMHTLWAREHNRVFNLVSAQHPDLARSASGDMTTYAVAASQVRSTYQSIVWHEMLPRLVGTARFASQPAYTGYNSSVDPSVSIEAAHVLGLLWHTMLASHVPRVNPDGKQHKKGRVSLVDAWFAPSRIAKEGGWDPVLQAAASSAASAVDILFVDEARTSFLGAKAQGLDLAAIDLQRARDHGVSSYNDARVAFGLAPVTSFDELLAGNGLSATVQTKLRTRLRELYGPAAANATAGTAVESVPEAAILDVMDLLVGGLLEGHLDGGIAGPTFAAILAEQFTRTRDGDRWWFENVKTGAASQLALASVDAAGEASAVANGAVVDVSRTGQVNHNAALTLAMQYRVEATTSTLLDVVVRNSGVVLPTPAR